MDQTATEFLRLDVLSAVDAAAVWIYKIKIDQDRLIEMLYSAMTWFSPVQYQTVFVLNKLSFVGSLLNWLLRDFEMYANINISGLDASVTFSSKMLRTVLIKPVNSFQSGFVALVVVFF